MAESRQERRRRVAGLLQGRETFQPYVVVSSVDRQEARRRRFRAVAVVLVSSRAASLVDAARWTGEWARRELVYPVGFSRTGQGALEGFGAVGGVGIDKNLHTRRIREWNKRGLGPLVRLRRLRARWSDQSRFGGSLWDPSAVDQCVYAVFFLLGALYVGDSETFLEALERYWQHAKSGHDARLAKKDGNSITRLARKLGREGYDVAGVFVLSTPPFRFRCKEDFRYEWSREEEAMFQMILNTRGTDGLNVRVYTGKGAQDPDRQGQMPYKSNGGKVHGGRRGLFAQDRLARGELSVGTLVMISEPGRGLPLLVRAGVTDKDDVGVLLLVNGEDTIRRLLWNEMSLGEDVGWFCWLATRQDVTWDLWESWRGLVAMLPHDAGGTKLYGKFAPHHVRTRGELIAVAMAVDAVGGVVAPLPPLDPLLLLGDYDAWLVKLFATLPATGPAPVVDLVHGWMRPAADGRYYGSRDWLRRILHVMNHLRAGTFRLVWLLSYRPNVIARMLETLHSSAVPGLRLVWFKSLDTMWRKELERRRRALGPKSKDVPLMVTAFRSGKEDLVNLQGILHEVHSLLPVSIQESAGGVPQAVWQYVMPLSSIVFNFHKVLATLKLEYVYGVGGEVTGVRCLNLESFPCRCQAEEFRPFAMPGRFPEGEVAHVGTCDVDMIRNGPLRDLLNNGCKTRQFCPQAASVDVLAAISASVYRLAKQLAKRGHVDVTATEVWVTTVLEKVSEQLGLDGSEPLGSVAGRDVRLADDVGKELKRLQRSLVFVYSDKDTNSFAMVCQRWYVEQVVSELTSEKVFKPRPDVVRDDWRLELRGRLKVMGLLKERVEDGVRDPLERLHGDTVSAVRSVFPRFYASFKSHKMELTNKPILRFLTAAAGIALTEPCNWLSWAFRSLQPIWDEIWIKMCAPLGVTVLGCWVVQSSSVVPARVRAYNKIAGKAFFRHDGEGGRSLDADVGFEGHDFSNMYGELNLVDLRGRSADWISECFGVRAAEGKTLLLVHRRKRKNRWLTQAEAEALKPSGSYIIVTVGKVLEMTALVLSSMLLEMGGVILEQKDGIPMGLPPCVYLANGYLFTYELEWFRHQLLLPLTVARLCLLRRLAVGVCRFVDDLICIDVSLRGILSRSSPLALDGIYPFGLVVTLQQCPSVPAGSKTEGVFLELRLRRDVWGVYTSMFNKWDYLPLEPRRYPNTTTAIARQARLGVVTSRCHTFCWCCMRREGLVEAVTELLSQLLVKNYEWSELSGKLIAFGPKFLGLEVEAGGGAVQAGQVGWLRIAGTVEQRLRRSGSLGANATV